MDCTFTQNPSCLNNVRSLRRLSFNHKTLYEFNPLTPLTFIKVSYPRMKMHAQAKSCYLKSNDSILKTVYLPNQQSIILGRCPETNITDTQCSRKQVQIYADYQEYKVFIQQIGQRPCGFNGFKTRKDVKFIGNHDDCLEILYGKYSYQIEFNPAPLKTLHTEKRTRDANALNEMEDKSFKLAKLENDVKELDNTDKKGQTAEEKRVNRPKKSTNCILEFVQSNKMNVSGQEGEDVGQNMWECEESGALLIYTTRGVLGSSKIAAYDMDGTLIRTKSGLVFPKDYDDWQLMYPDVPQKLKELSSSGYKIVVFTNQASIGSGRINANSFRKKLDNVIQRIGIPIQVFVATGNSIYRKPAIGMWQKLTERNDSIRIDKDSSFYVGDAAGRAKNWAPGKKKDHSLADRLLALNLDLKFYTPEEHFLGHKQAPFTLPKFNPSNLPVIDICSRSNIHTNTQEVILMVGCPGSGKSHFIKNYLNHYGYVNRDSLGSWQKCVAVMERYLSEKSSVVIDNTNPDSTSRQRYIEVAKRHKLPVRCFVMQTSVDHAKHNNKFRELTDPGHAKISEIIINSYVKNYQYPNMDEGFSEIVHINFVPLFEKAEDQQIYEMYLLEG